MDRKERQLFLAVDSPKPARQLHNIRRKHEENNGGQTVIAIDEGQESRNEVPQDKNS
jgi:hypothetical protein